MVDQVRAGIIGTGFMGLVHSRAICRAGASLTCVVGSSPEASRQGALRLGAESHAASVEELLGRDDVDVVHVCTPNATHAEIVRDVIDAGRHVVCEKPLTTRLVDAEELTTLASEARLTATVPFVYRFYPMVREARARVAAGRTGRVRLLHGSYLQDWLASAGDDDWRVDAATGGASRAFADIGVHWCDLIEFVSGHRISRLVAHAAIVETERGGRAVSTEDAAVLAFMTDRGASGSLIISQVSQGRKNRLQFSVDSAHESLMFDQENPDCLWIGGRDVNRELLRGTTEQPGAARYSILPAGHPQGYQDCFDAFVADTYSAIRGEAPSGLPTFADGLRAVHVTQAVLESARTEQWVDVPA